mgnify:CR=1 FL=1
MKRLLKVLFLPADDGGCGYHRIRMWDMAFRRLKIADSVLLDPAEDEEKSQKAIEVADVIVGKFGTLDYIRYIKNKWPRKVVVFDNDDNTLEIKPSNPAYKSFGTRDVWVPVKNVEESEYYKQATVGTQLRIKEMQAVPLWVTGITDGFNRYRNVKIHTELIETLLIADLVTSPTPTLSQFWNKYADTTAVVPNCLDLSYYPDVEVKRKRKNGEIRIGWSGGSSHSADWRAVMPLIREIMEKRSNITLVVAGSNFNENFGGLNVEFHPWTKWEAHPYRMKLLDLDFAIIPLADDESFNIYKSELKMEEFAALKVPMIIKDQLPYSPYIKRNVNCLAYKDNKELGICIERMIEDKEGLRANLVKNAHSWVVKERDIDKIAPDVVALYKSLLPEEAQGLIV